MNCLVRWRSVVAVAALVPILWLLGNVSAQGLSMLAAPRYDTLADDGRWLLIIGASMLVSSLVVGFVVAWCARAVGHASIRTLLAPSRAQTFAVLTAILLWLSLTGYFWASFKQDDLLTAFWYIVLGAAKGVFGAVWLVLASRAAASLRQFRAGVLLLGSALASQAAALGAYIVLMLLFQQAPPEPSLALFGLLTLLLMGSYVLPLALATLGFTAIWGGLLSWLDRRGTGKDGVAGDGV
jgi:hypothetical protein